MANKNSIDVTQKSIDDMVLNSIINHLSTVSSEVVTTVTQLGKVLRPTVSRSEQKNFPMQPVALRSVLNRITNRLRCRGITIQFSRSTDSNRTRYCTLRMR